MQCERFEQLLHEALDERQPPEHDIRLRRHAESCPACGRLLASQKALWVGLAQLQPPQPRTDFADRAVREFTGGHASSASPRRAIRRHRVARRAAWAVAAAALLILAPAIYWSFQQGSSSDIPPMGVVQDDHPIGIPDDPPPPAENSFQNPESLARNAVDLPQDAVAPVLSDREEQYAELLDRWRLQIAETGGRLGLTDADAPTVQGAAAVSQLTDRLRSPLAASIESTLNVLRTALPSANTEKSQSKPQARAYDMRAIGLA
jgi:hypothetical protein